jgi:hypothetical protein
MPIAAGGAEPLLTPQQLSSQLRRPAEVKIRPSRTIPAIFVVLVVLAIAAGWLVLFQHP